MTFSIPRPDWVSDRLLGERGENAGFQMYSREGNDAVAAMVLDVAAKVEAAPMRRNQAVSLVQEGVLRVTKTHPEVHDTEPEWAIVDAINALFDTQGWVHIDRDDI
jgi:hypothetical protein